MVKNIWKIIFIVSAGVSLWMLGGLLKDLYSYYRLDKFANAEITIWKVKETNKEEFILKAYFSYEVHGHVYNKSQKFLKPLFPNALAAKSSLKDLNSKSWKVWFNKKNPAKSSLQRNFPFKRMLHTLLAYGVFLYFIWLKTFIVSRSSVEPGY